MSTNVINFSAFIKFIFMFNNIFSTLFSRDKITTLFWQFLSNRKIFSIFSYFFYFLQSYSAKVQFSFNIIKFPQGLRKQKIRSNNMKRIDEKIYFNQLGGLKWWKSHKSQKSHRSYWEKKIIEMIVICIIICIYIYYYIIINN